MTHLKNIKEMLSIPTGGSKTSYRNVTTSGYSSYTDSQAFLGSQFWPQNSQCLSQDVSLSSRASQHSSEEIEQKLSNTYHTKPLLFGEFKDRGKPRGILNTFEEDKRRAKDISDSEATAKQWHIISQSINNIQELASSTDKNTSVCFSVLEKLDISLSTLQNSFSGLHSDFSQQMENLVNGVSSTKENVAALERKSEEATADLSSGLEKLNSKLEDLRKDQKREHHFLEEALKQLSTSVNEHSAKPLTKRVMDVAIQTSPDQEHLVSRTRCHKKRDATKLKCVSNSRGQSHPKVLSKDPQLAVRKRKDPLRSKSYSRKPLPLSQRKKHVVPDENRRPGKNYNKQQKMFSGQKVINQDGVSPHCIKRQATGKSKARSCLITPFAWWSQDSSGSLCVQQMEPIMEKMSAASRSGTPGSPGGPWQWFDMNSDSDF